MKFALFIAIAAFSSTSVLGSPTPGTTEVTKHPNPPAICRSDVKESADADPEQKSSTFEAASATQYWVCEAVSSSTRHYGWSQGKFGGRAI
jgi:hypothetical protein